MEVFEDFDDGKGSAWKDRLLSVVGRIEETNILIHIKDVGMTQSFNIFIQSNRLLYIAILSRRGREDWIVYNYAMDRLVVVGFDYLVFDFLLGEFS